MAGLTSEILASETKLRRVIDFSDIGVQLGCGHYILGIAPHPTLIGALVRCKECEKSKLKGFNNFVNLRQGDFYVANDLDLALTSEGLNINLSTEKKSKIEVNRKSDRSITITVV